jgi:hypothetical protein
MTAVAKKKISLKQEDIFATQIDRGNFETERTNFQ